MRGYRSRVMMRMGRKQVKKDQKIQYHREFKTGNKPSPKTRRKIAGRKVK